ncbi:hypothetical protein EHQ12_01355 [Leptospira gomenensis]|uniref:Uncharacterized protein n=1 Tax=Leptospira gomenensis TaxID=2484974 RepID=A0A5F1YCM1_9LEPT|nr:hypothetical protein [Leptospira gomenensis]TGK34701.1 hypothetical protein EHQ17_08520 [Leptospira gomenensis]TGK41867.1 hypothetical protein EHQ07_15490 [Leptospira gomenensis]TGK44810.1 hypothetical protein EHQ12_01355 [Leptospira gomenensis]TGK65193.1 hypothetical protein EHQ13_05870 [Leptospira gomenensis]
MTPYFAFVFSFFLIFACSEKNLKLQGELRKLPELPYYGSGFYVSASKVDKNDFEEIRKDLKNELASRAPKDGPERWKEISSLNGSEGTYILFQIVPETRVLPEFLNFEFSLNDKPAEKVWGYYVQTFTSKIRNSRYAALPAYGTFAYPYHPGATSGYFAGPILYDSDVTTDTEHIYRFLARFPVTNTVAPGKKTFFQVVTPAKSILKFEY